MSYTRSQLLQGTASQWTASNHLLLSGELGFETDTGRIKIGDGVTNWNALAYYGDSFNVHYTAQSLSGPQQTQARTNIGALSNDGGAFTTDGVGNMYGNSWNGYGGNFTEVSTYNFSAGHGISVVGSSSLDNGAITTDGAGNMTFTGVKNIHGGGLDIRSTAGGPIWINGISGVQMDFGAFSSNGLGGVAMQTLTVVHASSLDNGAITTDGSGTLNAANVNVGGVPVTVTLPKTGNMLWVDAVNGNDSTGTRGRFDLPFATPLAAQSAASAGDVIIVRPGTYTVSSLGKDQVNWYLMGATLSSTGLNSCFNDLGAAMSFSVFGFGTIKRFTFTGSGSATISGDITFTGNINANGSGVISVNGATFVAQSNIQSATATLRMRGCRFQMPTIATAIGFTANGTLVLDDVTIFNIAGADPFSLGGYTPTILCKSLYLNNATAATLSGNSPLVNSNV